MLNVMIDVTVFITSCHVSEKWNMGPVSSQMTIMPTAPTSAGVLPVQAVAIPESWSQFAPMPLCLRPISPPESALRRGGPVPPQRKHGSRYEKRQIQRGALRVGEAIHFVVEQTRAHEHN